MSDPTYFRILNGQFGLSDSRHRRRRLPPGMAGAGRQDWKTAVIAAYDTESTTWSCQITEMRMTATRSTRTKRRGHDLSAGREVPNPQKADVGRRIVAVPGRQLRRRCNSSPTSTTPNRPISSAAFDGVNPPKAIGTLYLAPLPDLGGVARTNLKTTVTWPVYDSQRLYGNATVSAPVPEPLSAAVGAELETADAGDGDAAASFRQTATVARRSPVDRVRVVAAT